MVMNICTTKLNVNLLNQFKCPVHLINFLSCNFYVYKIFKELIVVDSMSLIKADQLHSLIKICILSENVIFHK